MKKFLLASAALGLAAALNAPAAFADILMGVAGPVSGQVAVIGEQMKRGVEMAVKDINAAGGINGEKLVAEIGDDGCDPKQAVAVANQLAGKAVKGVIGPHFPRSPIPAPHFPGLAVGDLARTPGPDPRHRRLSWNSYRTSFDS